MDRHLKGKNQTINKKISKWYNEMTNTVEKNEPEKGMRLGLGGSAI